MKRAEEIRAFSERVRTFFRIFDAAFLYDEQAEDLLEEVAESLKEKISHNESALPVIMALGGRYSGEVDRAKAAEADALLRLLKARKALRAATLEESERVENSSDLLRELFGI